MVETTTTTTTTPAPDAPVETEPAPVTEAAAFATSALASDGTVVTVPKTPEEIAQQGTELGIAGDHSTGGNLAPVVGTEPGQASGPVYQRVWGMDADHTVKNRSDPDSLH